MKLGLQKGFLLSLSILFLSGALFVQGAIAADNAGSIAFATGQVSITSSDGTSRSASHGDAIYPGDRITTGAGGRIQMRFIDSVFISLDPNTAFKVDDYRYESKEDGSTRGIFTLLKGSARAMIGLASKKIRDNYKVNTLVATISTGGGAVYRVQLCQGDCADNKDDGLYTSVGQGAIILSNLAGTLDVTTKQTAFVAHQNSMPTLANYTIKSRLIHFSEETIPKIGEDEPIRSRHNSVPPAIIYTPPSIRYDPPGGGVPAAPAK